MRCRVPFVSIYIYTHTHCRAAVVTLYPGRARAPFRYTGGICKSTWSCIPMCLSLSRALPVRRKKCVPMRPKGAIKAKKSGRESGLANHDRAWWWWESPSGALHTRACRLAMMTLCACEGRAGTCGFFSCGYITTCWCALSNESIFNKHSRALFVCHIVTKYFWIQIVTVCDVILSLLLQSLYKGLWPVYC